MEKGAHHLIIISHLGSESGHKNEKLSLAPVAEELQKLLDRCERVGCGSCGFDGRFGGCEGVKAVRVCVFERLLMHVISGS